MGTAGKRFPSRRIFTGTELSQDQNSNLHDPTVCTHCNHEHDDEPLSAVQPAICDHELPITHQRTPSSALIIEIVFLCFALGLLGFRNLPGLGSVVGDLSISFVAIMVEAVPFMLLGAVVGGLIEVFVPENLLSRLLAGRRYSAVLVAAALGVIFPVCECAIVPIVRRLLRKGAPLSAALAFLLGAPIVNPIVAGSTWLAYRGDWTFVATRMGCGYAIAVAVALMASRMSEGDDSPSTKAAFDDASSTCCCGAEHAHTELGCVSKFFAAIRHACDDFFDVGRYLVIGAFVAALARTLISVDAVRDLFGAPGVAILMMMALAVALNLCSETDAFIAAGFRGVMPETAQMAFMVLGPMLDMKLILMYTTIFEKRFILSLALLTFSAVLATMLLMQYGFGGLPGGR
jgi:uncharacterized protein